MNLPIGTLFLIIGPSGVGKDTLIDGAKAALFGNPNFAFPIRHITRPKDSGGEIHFEISESEFDKLSMAQSFALSWQAHGLSYGVTNDIINILNQGTNVIINVSRTILDMARNSFAKTQIISISAPSEILAQRLHARGRETEDQIQDRIKRAAAYKVSGPDVIELINDGEREIAIAKLVAILKGQKNGNI